MYPSYETMVALDTNVLIQALRNHKFAKKVNSYFSGRESRIVLQDIVLMEAQKILHLPREKILHRIESILGKGVYVFSSTDEMRAEAAKMERQYHVCHSPDSVILSAAKTYSWTLLSSDKNMLRAAEFEGISAINPLIGVA